MGIIARSAVNAFLSRELDDFSWVKKLTRKELMRELREIAPDYRFKTHKPWRHQAACIFLGVCVPEFLYFLDMGAGKTKILIDVFAIRKALGEATSALVLADTYTNLYNWTEQVGEHSDLTCLPLDEGTERNMQILEEEDADIYVAVYQGLLYMVCDKQQAGRRGRRSPAYKPNRSKVERVASRFDTLLLDEVHTCKNHQSLTHRVVNQLAKRSEYRFGTTGTPTGRDRQDLWAQFYLVDRGKTLGETLGLFRAAFFEEKQGFAAPEYVFRDEMEGELRRMLQNRSISYSEEELGDMPRKQEIRVPIPMSGGVERYYEMVREGMVELFKSRGKSAKVEIQNSFVRWRQVVSGFIGLDADGARTEASFGSNKTEWLESQLDDLVASEGKVLLFHEFIPSGREIERVLSAKKIGYVSINGRVSKAQKQEAQRRFKEDGGVQVCVANFKSGSTAWNPHKVANKVVFFELPTSPITFTQALKRVYRRKGSRRVFVWYLLTKGSVEERMYGLLKEGRDIMQAITSKDGGDLL